MNSNNKCANILVVEDDPLNRIIASKFLKKLGHKITLAENGLQAVKAVENNQYDIILMDVNMPIMGGKEATKIIREMQQSFKIKTPIIGLTTVERQECIEAGMDDHLFKPCKFQQLDSKIEQYLNLIKEQQSKLLEEELQLSFIKQHQQQQQQHHHHHQQQHQQQQIQQQIQHQIQQQQKPQPIYEIAQQTIEINQPESFITFETNNCTTYLPSIKEEIPSHQNHELYINQRERYISSPDLSIYFNIYKNSNINNNNINNNINNNYNNNSVNSHCNNNNCNNINNNNFNNNNNNNNNVKTETEINFVVNFNECCIIEEKYDDEDFTGNGNSFYNNNIVNSSIKINNNNNLNNNQCKFNIGRRKIVSRSTSQPSFYSNKEYSF
ncbi:hypothetical protein ACTFIU_000516 [Dictyostelium citrinum]